MEADHTTRVPVKDLSCVGEAVLVAIGVGFKSSQKLL